MRERVYRSVAAAETGRDHDDIIELASPSRRKKPALKILRKVPPLLDDVDDRPPLASQSHRKKSIWEGSTAEP